MSVLSFDKKVVDNIPIYYAFNKEYLEFKAFVKIKNNKINHYCFEIKLPIKNWSEEKMPQKINYRDMYSHLFKQIVVEISKKKSIDYEVIERDKLPNNKIIIIDVNNLKAKKYKNFYEDMINGRPYNIVGGIWS